jgi:hypothetical protein
MIYAPQREKTNQGVRSPFLDKQMQNNNHQAVYLAQRGNKKNDQLYHVGKSAGVMQMRNKQRASLA